jgi:hypothetical protein
VVIIRTASAWSSLSATGGAWIACSTSVAGRTPVRSGTPALSAVDDLALAGDQLMRRVSLLVASDHGQRRDH